MIIRGLSGLNTSFNSFLKSKEKQIVDLRKAVALELLEALFEPMPVWSGRALRSLSVNGTGNATEVHPDRRDTKKNGRWESHPEWAGQAMRAASEAVARANVESADYSLNARVEITSSSYIWHEIDTKQHPYSNPVKHKVIVSEIALAQVRAKFGSLLK